LAVDAPELVRDGALRGAACACDLTVGRALEQSHHDVALARRKLRGQLRRCRKIDDEQLEVALPEQLRLRSLRVGLHRAEPSARARRKSSTRLRTPSRRCAL